VSQRASKPAVQGAREPAEPSGNRAKVVSYFEAGTRANSKSMVSVEDTEKMQLQARVTLR
jgi:hypothetical protein